MSDDPLIYPGAVKQDDPIRQRPEDKARREVELNRKDEPPPDPTPGGAQGGDDSNSADWLVDHPRDTDPLGDTDQHSDPGNLPPQRERENQRRGERENQRGENQSRG